MLQDFRWINKPDKYAQIYSKFESLKRSCFRILVAKNVFIFAEENFLNMTMIIMLLIKIEYDENG